MNFGEFVGRVFDNQTADSPNHFCLCCQYPGRVLCYAAYEMRLATTLFDREHLKVLKLAGPMMINLPDLPCLPKLVVLELNCVRYRQKETLSDLISSCPMLHSLTLKRNTKLDKLKVCTIASPTLKHLEICFNFDPDYPYWQHDLPASYYKARELKRVKLEIDAPALEYLHVEDTMSREISILGLTSVREVGLETRSCNGFINTLVADLVQSLDHAKFMKLGGNVVAYGSSLHWSSLVCLIDRCVKLEFLEVDVFKSKKYKAKSYPRRDSLHVPTCLSSSLRQVTIKGFDDEKGLMAILRFILDHGLVMETVDLCFDDDEERYGLLKEILMLSRASSTCKIQVSNAS